MSENEPRPVTVTIECAGEKRVMRCRCAVIVAVTEDGTAEACFVGSAKARDLAAVIGAGADAMVEALLQAGVPLTGARMAVSGAGLSADPRGHAAGGIEVVDLAARDEIRKMAREMGVDADL